MFESNTDVEFDKIFDDDSQPNTTVINTKRSIENEVCSNQNNKKFCLGDDVITPLKTGMHRHETRFKLQVKTPMNSPNNKNVVLRKFPGPAGLLPERRDFNIDINTLEVNNKESKQDNATDMVICSQMSVRAFNEGPWDVMSKDFHSNDSSLFLPNKYNIAWIKDKVKNNKLINQKAPFVATIIQNIEYSKSKTAVVTMLLRDTTGQIHGTIIYDLFEEYINELKVGSVIVLKQFGVLTTDRGYNLYVTITTNNLVAIYSNDVDNTEGVSKVKVTTIQKFSIDDFMKNINEVKMRHRSAERLQSILGSSETNLNMQPQIRHINNTFTSSIKSKSSSDINTKYIDQNDANNFRNILFPSKVNNLTNSPSVNRISSSSDSGSNNSNKTKFNFKPLKCNNNKTTEIISSESNDDKNENLIKNTQISIVTNDNLENSMILQNILEGVDADLLFEDF